ncbi:hypothetical protein [Arthrobacter sp. 9MFCol3.1]|uniref:hypothetical protein n=1 Tax=Arthrobacter sp. 9MFCol3.1 TaxID=1150398 RepID=UPI00047CBDA5|nr:hypothetical protein [Arthrobacter sp. 9MFCol3.1]
MSQEQPPIRSRRELRQARDERLDTPGPGEPTEAEITGRSRRVADAPVDSVRADSVPAGTERSSQVRARDRAALRTIKELAEKEGQLAGGGPPTRRQLRLLELATETAPATQANTIVPVSPRTRANPVVSPAGKDAAGKDTAPTDAASKGAAPKGASPAVSAAPTLKAPAAPKAPAADGAGPGGTTPEGMTVEQALAARELLAEQAKNQVAKMEHIAATDPDAVDPAVLAEQIALAERAAILNRRAAAKQKLAEQNSQPAAPRNDPTTANNLAMVTPLEFEKIPGVERPVMKRPATSYVPVVTNPGPRVDSPRKPGLRRPGISRQKAAGPATGSAAGRAGVLARAEAAAKAGTARPASAANSAGESDERFVGGEPVAANAAYGLEPLDAATAGLGRARRLRMLQLGVLAVGIVALIAGITLIVTGLAH